MSARATLVLAALLAYSAGCKSEPMVAAVPTEPDAAARERPLLPPPDVTLKAAIGEKVGFSIEVPEAAKRIQDLDFMTAYEFVLPGGLYSLDAKVAPVIDATGGKLPDLAAAEAYAGSLPAFSGARVLARTATEVGFLITYEQATLSFAAGFARQADGAYLLAECRGPRTLATVVERMCGSLRATR